MSSWVDELAATPLAERARFLEQMVVGEFKVWLLMEPSDEFPLEQSYFELGLTSLGATEIKETLEARLGQPVQSATLFNNPTAAHLLKHLREEVLAEHFPTGTAAPATPDSSAESRRALVGSLLDELYQN
ncbi:Phosphopantetheine attachment site [Saccharopolyspora antimicrobica]|uniref:Phosphopantetheine attachment site n=1 Tax=Saccharopolyspora antimicrobica TaxID=455193 RepID=A0A1I5GNK5_9PSEU|nr:acyl carrier protein [Saccharopolyspora antimicrobica]RKT87432.1 phosphopantetheine binding protein [Saccharopolyspora antimicrobica]SFO37654.1 Phosphopantetheine attachment site [Saccharopolyspora antimicrobica]